MRSSAKLSFGLAFGVMYSLALAQSNLGELLDARATRLSAQQFRDEIVQRSIFGPLATGGSLELIYASNGMLKGIGMPPNTELTIPVTQAQISGEWTIDDAERVCSSMKMGVGTVSTNLPPRCQFWFKLGNAYFVSDSDSDRRTKILRREVKSSSAHVAAAAVPSDLGQLLDAGAKRLTPEEFRQGLVQRVVVGAAATGGNLEIMYATNGSIAGLTSLPNAPQLNTITAPLRGEWDFDKDGRVCAVVEITPSSGPPTVVPRRCQAWYKLGGTYFLSDSDTDRHAKVLPRALKQ